MPTAKGQEIACPPQRARDSMPSVSNCTACYRDPPTPASDLCCWGCGAESTSTSLMLWFSTDHAQERGVAAADQRGGGSDADRESRRKCGSDGQFFILFLCLSDGRRLAWHGGRLRGVLAGRSAGRSHRVVEVEL
eukprot:4089151-Prymnesium_polylepis.1